MSARTRRISSRLAMRLRSLRSQARCSGRSSSMRGMGSPPGKGNGPAGPGGTGRRARGVPAGGGLPQTAWTRAREPRCGDRADAGRGLARRRRCCVPLRAGRATGPRNRLGAGVTAKVISRTGTRSGERQAKVVGLVAWRQGASLARPLPAGAVAACRYARGACDRPRDRLGTGVMAKVISRTGTRSGERQAKVPSALWSFHAPASLPCVALLVKNRLPSRLGRKLSRRPHGSGYREPPQTRVEARQSGPTGRVWSGAPVPSSAVWRRPAAFGVEQ